jgi:hypothetical protein
VQDGYAKLQQQLTAQSLFQGLSDLSPQIVNKLSPEYLHHGDPWPVPPYGFPWIAIGGLVPVPADASLLTRTIQAHVNAVPLKATRASPAMTSPDLAGWSKTGSKAEPGFHIVFFELIERVGPVWHPLRRSSFTVRLLLSQLRHVWELT